MKPGEGPTPTVLDVIENSLGARPTPDQLSSLSVAEMKVLRDGLADLSEAQSGDPAGADAYLVGGFFAAFWSQPHFRGDLSDSLLYYPTLVVLDPLADFFDDRSRLPPTRPLRFLRPDGKKNTISQGPDLWSRWGTYGELQGDRSAAAQKLARIVGDLYELETPIRSGAVVLRSQWPVLSQRAHQIDSSVRADIRSKEMQDFIHAETARGALFTAWDNLATQGPLATLPSLVPADDPWQFQHVFYYLAKSLALADVAGAQYVPSTDHDLDLLRAKVVQVVGGRHPGEFLSEVARIVVPNLAIPIKEAAAMRKSSVEFDNWRRMLSKMQRQTATYSPDEMRQFVADEMVPLVRKVEREVKASRFSSSGGNGVSEFVFDFAPVVAVAAMTGGTSKGALTAGAVAGMAGWIRRAYGPTSPSSPVLAALIKHGRRTSAA